jgi:hypothetical protein
MMLGGALAGVRAIALDAGELFWAAWRCSV